MTPRLMLVPLLIAALIAGCGGDGDRAGQPPQSLEELVQADFAAADGSGNGRVEPGELRATIERDFRAMDLNGDGVVTIEDIELETARQGAGRPPAETPPLAEHLPYDENGDGTITLDEYRRHVEREIVRRMDADGDGAIAQEEVAEHYGL